MTDLYRLLYFHGKKQFGNIKKSHTFAAPNSSLVNLLEKKHPGSFSVIAEKR